MAWKDDAAVSTKNIIHTPTKTGVRGNQRLTRSSRKRLEQQEQQVEKASKTVVPTASRKAPFSSNSVGPWTTLLLLCSFAVVSALVFFGLATPKAFELVISKIPILRDDPFVHIIFGVFSKANTYSYWQYVTTLAVGAPVGYSTICFFISYISGEWNQRRAAAIDQVTTAALHLAMSAPVMAYWFQRFIEGHWGQLYMDSTTHSPLYQFVITPLCYWIITDTSFYWQHRTFHSKWLYMQFHAFHHKCRPITTFCGNSAGIIELFVVEFCHALMPPLFMPIHAKTWVFLALGNQAWTIYLHTFDDCGISRLPGWLYDCRDHHVHHYYGIKSYNFGLFFQFWDRVMGTYLDKDNADGKVVKLHQAGHKPEDEAQATAASTTAAPTKPLRHFNTRLPFVWTWRIGANVSKVALVTLAIYCDLYHRVERFPFHDFLTSLHPLLGETLPMFTIGGIGYTFLHLGAGSTYEWMHRRRIQYPPEVLRARNAQIIEELKVWADGFAIQLAVGTTWHALVDPYSPWWGYFDTHEYTLLWALAHVLVYFTYMDYMSFAVHYHILHGNNWAWENLHMQHHQIKNPTAFGGVAVHPIEGVIQLALPANFIFWILPVNFWLHSALMLLILIGPALGGHDGSEGNGGAGPFDFSKHYYHHTTWHRGRFGYKNYALFWPFWDRIYGTFVNSEEEYREELKAIRTAKLEKAASKSE